VTTDDDRTILKRFHDAYERDFITAVLKGKIAYYQGLIDECTRAAAHAESKGRLTEQRRQITLRDQYQALLDTLLTLKGR